MAISQKVVLINRLWISTFFWGDWLSRWLFTRGVHAAHKIASGSQVRKQLCNLIIYLTARYPAKTSSSWTWKSRQRDRTPRHFIVSMSSRLGISSKSLRFHASNSSHCLKILQFLGYWQTVVEKHVVSRQLSWCTMTGLYWRGLFYNFALAILFHACQIKIND